MNTYTELHANIDQWYDNIADVIEHAKPDSFGDSHTSRFNQYFYAYLSCFSEFPFDSWLPTQSINFPPMIQLLIITYLTFISLAFLKLLNTYVKLNKGIQA